MLNGNVISLGLSAGAIIALIGLNIKMIRDTRVEAKRDLENETKDVVRQPACHSAQKATQKRIDDLDNHLSERFDDLKLFIKNGGK